MQSHTLIYNSHNNVISLPKGKLAVIQDVNDLLIVDTDNALMICKKGNESNIRKFLNDVHMKLGEEYI